ncbi:MAG: glucans biosynthesis glucosyltransferase MdoH [Alcaligenaceae bacterium]
MLTVRRLLFGVLATLSFAAMLALMHAALSPSVSTWGTYTLLALFAVTLPWTVVGFWNSSIGFLVGLLARDPLAVVLPIGERASMTDPITSSTAVVLCIRNETPTRLERNLEAMMQSLAATGFGQQLHVYVLSDTNDELIAQQEQLCFAAMTTRWTDRIALTYRRRTDNKGYKAGNIADFCARWGHLHDFVVTLDADSFMTGRAILRLVRIMQANPSLGILQGLVVGLPSTSGFTRLFQFGMRLGMRPYTMGSAWWQADCGPYWGHNAAIRIKPFIEHCDLPQLPDHKGTPRHILSHDQVEAVLMRRAGFEVRVIPQEDESWEENPPTLIEYIRRDLRWCEGNLQYVHLLSLPGLKFLSRYQLCIAILMFLSSPAWIALLLLSLVLLCLAPTPAAFMHNGLGITLLSTTLLMWYLPKIAGALDVVLRANERKRFGGGLRFAFSFTFEMIFSLLMTPITWLNHTIFIVGLLFGKKSGWTGQARDDHSVPLSVALRQFWPHTLSGLVLTAAVWHTHPTSLPYALIMLSGLLLAIPIAVLTSWPSFGRLLIRWQLVSLPEELAPPAALTPLDLEVLRVARGPDNSRRT